jgi:very-short-patch-repair endonuclease
VAIANLASAQHGVVTLRQLEGLGLGCRAVRHRAAAGRLRRLHSGIYASGVPTRDARWMAAVLACGPGSVLSHRAAAALWDLCPARSGPVDVTVPGRAGRSRPGIRGHCSHSLEAADRACVRGIPCTALARTLLDLASVVDRRALERAFDRAEALRVFDLAAIEDVLSRGAGRRGSGALRSLLREYTGATTTQSRAEERFLRLVERSCIERPRVNEWIALEDGGGYRPDFLWPREWLVVEIDGRSYHARRRAFRHDRRRDRRLALLGYETRRYDALEVIEEPDRVVTEVRAFLAARRR